MSENVNNLCGIPTLGRENVRKCSQPLWYPNSGERKCQKMLTTFVVSQLWGEKMSENVHNLCGIPTLGRENVRKCSQPLWYPNSGERKCQKMFTTFVVSQLWGEKMSENVHNLCGIPTLGRENVRKCSQPLWYKIERIYDLKLSENVNNLCGIPTLGREEI